MEPVPLTVNTVTLTAHEYRSRVSVDEDLFKFRRTCDRNEILDQVDRRMTYELHRAVYGLDHPPKHVISYPTTWWDAFKLRFFPKPLIEKYPVNYCHVTVSLSETYPEFEPILYDRSPIIKLLVSESYPSFIK